MQNIAHKGTVKNIGICLSVPWCCSAELVLYKHSLTGSPHSRRPSCFQTACPSVGRLKATTLWDQLSHGAPRRLCGSALWFLPSSSGCETEKKKRFITSPLLFLWAWAFKRGLRAKELYTKTFVVYWCNNQRWQVWIKFRCVVLWCWFHFIHLTNNIYLDLKKTSLIPTLLPTMWP